MTRWRPSSGPDAARTRAAILDRARGYFAGEDILAVDTPALTLFAGSDPAIDNLTVQTVNKSAYFLHTSPEFCMKRLLAAGYPDIYSICRVFRDGESGSQHLPEFTMIEWYRLGYDLDTIIADATALVARCLDDPALGDNATSFDYRDAFRDFAGVDVLSATADKLADAAGADKRLRQSIGDDRDTWLDWLLSSVVAPRFPSDRLTVVRHFPSTKAALARPCPADSRFADRFEVFFGATELANGYVELTDAKLQQQRFAEEQTVRSHAGRAATPWDEQLIAALDAGLPDCAGVAVGVERLQMIHDGTEDIGDVVTFTTGRHDD